jgi:hypothetical protein
MKRRIKNPRGTIQGRRRKRCNTEDESIAGGRCRYIEIIGDTGLLSREN